MATRTYEWVGYGTQRLNSEVGGANTITFGPIKYGVLPLLSDLNARITVTYDATQVGYQELDIYMSSMGWTPL